MSRSVSQTHFLTVQSAAEQLDISAKTVRRWIDAGRIPAYRLGPRVLRVKQSDLNKLAKRVTVYGGDAA